MQPDAVAGFGASDETHVPVPSHAHVGSPPKPTSYGVHMVPPQSTSVSSPFFTLSPQARAASPSGGASTSPVSPSASRASRSDPSPSSAVTSAASPSRLPSLVATSLGPSASSL